MQLRKALVAAVGGKLALVQDQTVLDHEGKYRIWQADGDCIGSL